MDIIQPSEYYDEASGGQIPVFRPSMEQFKDFKTFMEAIDPYGRHSGIVKVVPPKEWKDKLPDIKRHLERLRVRNPIIQHIMGSRGMYTQTNVEKRRPYTLAQWLALCEQSEHRPPEVGCDRTARQPVTPLSRKRDKVCSNSNNREVQQQKQQQPPSANTRSKSLAAAHESSSPLKNKRQILSDEIALAQSDTSVPLPRDLHCPDPDKYSVEYCKELERNYWRNLTFTQPMYGADMAGTLFDKSVRAWNVNSLDNMLNRLGVSVPGVNEPYLYFGMWKATFAWHVEDMDLYSINYLHFGAPKQWYAIPTTHTKKFENVMQNLFPQEHKECPEFLRHKTFIISPKLLHNHSIPVHRCVQHEGEFMITFPFGYHAGYNLGLNCAESVNFALDSWIEIGKRAKACSCISDSVMIDVSIFDQQNDDANDADDNGSLLNEQVRGVKESSGKNQTPAKKKRSSGKKSTGNDVEQANRKSGGRRATKRSLPDSTNENSGHSDMASRKTHDQQHARKRSKASPSS
ncbi:JmjC domain, hydroxylase-domain-containing protein [Zychaea mexicana]|uniref:JmjC domain, hydroxylase-domain-containing protein n=1 Tax=Zychaea mexicana TaxID=64656 RepID=UPI0022FF0DBF|nr:JmjC domain, hydroxylase-domain-containing protein [Zychaea mexicana]KAI9491044.1 JmjC domain, hydroxylase-domain-containing protein [Zychaea mexicana]